MFRRVGNILVNLNNVNNIMLWNKTIEYNIVGKRWTSLFGTGGTSDIKVKESFTSEDNARKEFENLAQELKKIHQLM